MSHTHTPLHACSQAGIIAAAERDDGGQLAQAVLVMVSPEVDGRHAGHGGSAAIGLIPLAHYHCRLGKHLLL
jgi:hypothetical protein